MKKLAWTMLYVVACPFLCLGGTNAGGKDAEKTSEIRAFALLERDGDCFAIVREQRSRVEINRLVGIKAGDKLNVSSKLPYLGSVPGGWIDDLEKSPSCAARFRKYPALTERQRLLEISDPAYCRFHNRPPPEQSEPLCIVN